MDISLSIPVKSIYNILIRISLYFMLVAYGCWGFPSHTDAQPSDLTVWYVSHFLLAKLDIETFLMWIGLTRMFAIDLAFSLGFWYISHNLNEYFVYEYKCY